MDPIICKVFFVLITINAIGVSVAQAPSPTIPSPSLCPNCLDPMFRFFEYFAHLDGAGLSQVLSDFLIWYRQQLNFGDGFLPEWLNKRRHALSFGAAEPLSATSSDEVDVLSPNDFRVEFQKLIDSLLPSPNSVVSTTTKKPIVEVQENSIGRRFYSAVEPSGFNPQSP